MNQVCLNGKFLPATPALLRADNRGYRYGEGLFETMRRTASSIPLLDFHLDRLFEGISRLGFRPPASFTPGRIRKAIDQLVVRNRCGPAARVRLSVFRGNGALTDPDPPMQWLLEAWPLAPNYKALNAKGLAIDFFPDAQKPIDQFSSLKTSSYLAYAMASRYARSRGLDDCLLSNSQGRIADASVANLFLIKNRLVITPALTEGPVAGVMRRFLLERLPAMNFEVREGVVTRNDLDSFDEAFLTNAVYGIRWVGRFQRKKFKQDQVREIYRELITPLFA